MEMNSLRREWKRRVNDTGVMVVVIYVHSAMLQSVAIMVHVLNNLFVIVELNLLTSILQIITAHMFL